MRVLYFVERFWPLIGGIEVISARTLPELRARGHEITVITSREHDALPEYEAYAGIPVHRLRLAEPLHSRDLEAVAEVRARVTAIARDVRPDVVHVLFMGASVFYATRTVLGDAPMIVSFHGNWPGIRMHPLGATARLLDAAAWVTACSRSALDNLLAPFPAVAGKSSVILNGFDPADDAEPEPPPSGPATFLAAGRVVAGKGFDVAIDAFAIVNARYPETRLIVAGDGPERAALEARTAAAGLSPSVTFTGWVSPQDIATLIVRTTALVMPSHGEGLPLVALEAALGARPTIASAVGGLPEIIEHGRSGLLCPVDDVGAFAQGMVALVQDRDKAITMGREARQRALREFSAHRHTDAWDALYRRVAQEASGRVPA